MSYNECEYCNYLVVDEETNEEYCSVDMDEDEFARFLSNKNETCPYFRSNDEYEVVRHQN